MQRAALSSPSPITSRALALAVVLGHSRQVQELVQQSALELASANTTLHQVAQLGAQHPELAHALQQNANAGHMVQQASEQLTQVTQMLAQELEALNLALHDPVTGLPTRALFEDRLAQGLAQAERHGTALALMLIALDNLKKINAEHGRPVGDAVLQTMADRLNENTRQADTLCHVGGSQFVFLVVETGEAAHVAKLAEKVVNTLQAPCQLSTGTLSVQPSIGIALFPQDGTTADQLLASANTALQRAKQSEGCYAFVQDVEAEAGGGLAEASIAPAI